MDEHLHLTLNNICNAPVLDELPSDFFHECYVKGHTQFQYKGLQNEIVNCPTYIKYKDVVYMVQENATRKGQYYVCKYNMFHNPNSVPCPHALALKSIPEDEHEVSVIQLLQQSSGDSSWICPYGLVQYENQSQYGSQYGYAVQFIAMEWMDGSAEELIGNVTHEQAVELLFEVTKAVLALTRMLPPLYYNDLKCANILYKCVGVHQYKILLGDLGSLYTYGEKAVTTYVSPFAFQFSPKVEDRELHSSAFRANEYNILWGLCIIYIQLMCGKTTMRHFKMKNIQILLKQIRYLPQSMQQRVIFVIRKCIKETHLHGFLYSLMMYTSIYDMYMFLQGSQPPLPVSSKVHTWWNM